MIRAAFATTATNVTLTAGTLVLSAVSFCQMALASQLLLALSELTAALQWQTLFLANPMSTSHYSSRPFQGPTPTPPNKKRHSLLFASGFWALAVVDIMALAGSTDIIEALTFAGLTLINVAVLLHITR